MSHGTAPESAELPPPTLEEVSPGIFAYVQLDGSWFLNNAGIIVGDDSAIVIDTLGTEARSRAFHAALRRTTDKPVPVLVNTHSHADHTHGNFLFAPQTAIVAHELCREEVLVANVDALRRSFPTANFGNLPKTPAPMVTFAERLNLFAGEADDWYFKRNRRVLQADVKVTLASGAEFDGRRLVIRLDHLDWYVNATRQIIAAL